MAFDITNTYQLLRSVQSLAPLHTFLQDRYFPTLNERDIFNSTKVIVEYKDHGKKASPYIVPRYDGVPFEREGYEMKEFEPAHIGVKRALTIDDLEKRGFGEALFSNMSPDQRQGLMILQDLDDMRAANARRREAMAAEVIFTNGVVMNQYADDLGSHQDREIHFYSESTNPATYTPSANWTTTEDSGKQIFNDLHAMVSMLSQRGLPASEVLVPAEVANIMLNNEAIQKYLDNRRYELGSVAPAELPAGVTRVMTLNVFGRMLDILCYEDTYTDTDGKLKPFIPAGYIAVLAPNVGHTVYGAITQLEQSDGQFHTYQGTDIPKYLSDPAGNTRTIELKSAPLCIPFNKAPFISAKVLA